MPAAAREEREGPPATASICARRWARCERACRNPEFERNAEGLDVRGVWGKELQATFAPIDSFLGRPLAADDDPAEAVLRHLRAFGPAAPKDVRTWSYKTNLREVNG